MKDKITLLRFVRIVSVFLIGVLCFALLMSYITHDEDGDAPLRQDTSIAGASIGGAFELTRHDGEVVTDQDLQGTPYLIFFGFTYCPDICPTELATMTRMLKTLRQDQRDHLRVLFVSVDPERDTVEQMKDYMSLFHEKIEGLTGTPAQIEKIKKAYRVYSAKVQTESMSDYTVDHSAFIYFFDSKGQLRHIFKTNTPEADMKEAILPYL